MPSFIQTLVERWPLPSVDELEASHFELSAGPYPEFAARREKGEEYRPSMSLAWIKNMFSRQTPEESPSKEKSETLLPTVRDRECSSGRSSTDVESQGSSDASTLLERDQEKPASRIDARVVSDAIIGLSDGLTVPFALTAGLSALGDTKVVIFAGLAELIAGAISMGLGGYLGAKSEEDSYKETLSSTRRLVADSPSTAAASIADVLAPYELPQHLTEDLTFHLAKSPHLLPFLMTFQHNAAEQASSRAITCALTIATGYFLGGFLPLLPYFFVAKNEVFLALWWSLGVMALTLFVFGYGKTCFVSGWRGKANVWQGAKGGIQMMLVGGVAAGCAMGLVRVFHSFAA